MDKPEQISDGNVISPHCVCDMGNEDTQHLRYSLKDLANLLLILEPTHVCAVLHLLACDASLNG